MLRFGKGFIIGVGVALFIASAANAKTYRFRVNCADETYVAQWEADSPDLDKDYFRVATVDTNRGHHQFTARQRRHHFIAVVEKRSFAS